MENPNTVPTDDYKTDSISSEEDNNTNSIMTIAYCSAEDSALSIDDMKKSIFDSLLSGFIKERDDAE